MIAQPLSGEAEKHISTTEIPAPKGWIAARYTKHDSKSYLEETLCDQTKS